MNNPLYQPQDEYQALLAELDLHDSQSLLRFGAEAQQRLTAVSERMLEGVRGKDLGAAGTALAAMIDTLRGFDTTADAAGSRQWLRRLLGRGDAVARVLREYEQVREQIERISLELERHKHELLTDVTALDRLYAATLDQFRALERYIVAGERKLAELDERVLPAQTAQTEASGDPLAAQRLRDLRAARDQLERRIHDLRLTRQVAMQALPSIRLVQDNDKALIEKIDSTLINTVPLWRQQLAQAVTIQRSARAAAAVQAASDLTNQLLVSNAEQLRQANAVARRQSERGLFDLEAIKTANRALRDTIEDSLRSADEGRRARAAAAVELHRLEEALRQTLTKAGGEHAVAPAAT